jgi:ABC-type uncharacterized transport system fused permease/ATPase subunit
MEPLIDTLVNQASKASPTTEVVYSLIILILGGISVVFFRMYKAERKANEAWAEKSLKATELLSTVHLRLEDQRKNQDKFLEFSAKLDRLIDYTSDIKELKNLLEVIKDSFRK